MPRQRSCYPGRISRCPRMLLWYPARLLSSQARFRDAPRDFREARDDLLRRRPDFLMPRVAAKPFRPVLRRSGWYYAAPRQDPWRRLASGWAATLFQAPIGLPLGDPKPGEGSLSCSAEVFENDRAYERGSWFRRSNGPSGLALR